MKKLFTIAMIALSVNCMGQTITLTKAQFQKSLDSAINVSITAIQSRLLFVSTNDTALIKNLAATVKELKLADSTIKADMAKLNTTVSNLSADTKTRLISLETWRTNTTEDLRNAAITLSTITGAIDVLRQWIDDKQATFNLLSNK